jgi:hypothetical protein
MIMEVQILCDTEGRLGEGVRRRRKFCGRTFNAFQKK